MARMIWAEWRGPVRFSPNRTSRCFMPQWERRAFAITLAMAMPGGWNIDMSRFAREDRPPEDYLSKSYYQIWLAGLERLMLESGLIASDEIAAGKSLHPAKPVAKTLTPEGCCGDAASGWPDRAGGHAPCSLRRWRARARQEYPSADPYAVAAICAWACRRHRTSCWVVMCFPTATRRVPAKIPQWLYTVTFRRPRVVGRGVRTGSAGVGRRLGTVSGARADGARPASRSRGTRAVPGIPRDADGPVFREPWEAQAFAMALALHARGLFTLERMGRHACRSNQVARKRQAILIPARPITGIGWPRWNGLISTKGVASLDTLHRYREAWDHAADRTPHGSPIVLKPEDFAGLCECGRLVHPPIGLTARRYSRHPFARKAHAGHSPQP